MATPSPEQITALLTKGEKEGQAIILWTVGIGIRFCIFGWDYFMNLPKEIKYIWKKKFTITSGLYVANRYYGLLQFAVCIWLLTTPITHAVSDETCKRHWRKQVDSATLSLLFRDGLVYFAAIFSLILNLREPRNTLPLGNDFSKKNLLSGWKAPTPEKHVESYELSASGNTSIAIITTTDTIRTYV
ncbi:hypothetical protein DXG01_007677 [Tephrocybe rancida]|nr:hypothetical protein DXG01_007677 [Tephrocybe rancida]